MAKNIPPKPPSNIFKGYGLKETSAFLSTKIDRHIVRDNFTISTWLLLGAFLQCLLLALPIRISHAMLPVLLLLGYRFSHGLLMCFGVIKHPYADGVTPNKTVAVYPEPAEVNGEKRTTDQGICVIMLFARCHSPLGAFAPYYKDLADRMRSLIYELDTSSPMNGFLGGESWINTCDRDAGSEVMTLCYFESHEKLQEFAHGTHHRKIWDWWNKLAAEKKVGHISIAHEVYVSKKGDWEGVYVNQAPSMFAATQHWVPGGKDQGSWQTPVVPGKGRYRSALGRMGKSKGDDNQEYGEEPYADV